MHLIHCPIPCGETSIAMWFANVAQFSRFLANNAGFFTEGS